MLLKIFSFFLPWPLRRLWLNKVFGYQIDRGARIGWAWIFPRHLHMAKGSRIDALTVAINLDKMVLEENATIGRSNWITGFPTGTASRHFKHQAHRKAELWMKTGAAITKQHHIDCTHTVYIGRNTTIAGYRSQLLTHSIDINQNRQDSAPILIGDYCFLGTNSVVLGGAQLPDYCVLGAMSLLNKPYNETWFLYGGNPAKPIKELSRQARYFDRVAPFVY